MPISRTGRRAGALRLATALLVSVAGASALRAAVLSVPDDAFGAPASSATVSVSVTPGDGALGMDIRLDFSPSVLQATSVTTTPLTSGFSLTYNTGVPGRVLISLFRSSAMIGSGAVVDVHFNVVGSLGAQTALDLVSAQINEGSIPASLDDGNFTVCAGGFPVEVGGLAISGNASTSVAWTGQAPDFQYDVASGLVSELARDGGVAAAACLANDVPSSPYVDARGAPPAGNAWYYVVRSQNACGTGSYGFASSGAERIPLAACP
jgi:hypothetical protein